MVAVDRREQIGAALDERHERAHRERDAALGQIAADPIERHQHRELLVDEPAEPLARDLRALVWRWERVRGRALSAVAAPASRAAHDASTLMFLDDVQLLLDDDICGVECAAAAVRARVR